MNNMRLILVLILVLTGFVTGPLPGQTQTQERTVEGLIYDLSHPDPARRQESARILKTHIWSRENCAKCARLVGETEQAIGYYREALRVAADTNRLAVNTHIEYADYLRQLGRLDDALREYEAILVKRPGEARATKAIQEIREHVGATQP